MQIMMAALMAIFLTIGSAFAHAHLRTSEPEEGAAGSPPAQLSLGFSEVIEPRLSRIAVIARDGGTVAEAASLVPSNDPRRMILKLPKLAAGVYLVKWVVVSIDTHRSEGSYSFTVTP